VRKLVVTRNVAMSISGIERNPVSRMTFDDLWAAHDKLMRTDEALFKDLSKIYADSFRFHP